MPPTIGLEPAKGFSLFMLDELRQRVTKRSGPRLLGVEIASATEKVDEKGAKREEFV